MKADFYPIKTLALLDGLERDVEKKRMADSPLDLIAEGKHYRAVIEDTLEVDPTPKCLNPDKLIERICQLEREKAAILAMLDDNELARLIADHCMSCDEEIEIINEYRVALKERIEKI